MNETTAQVICAGAGQMKVSAELTFTTARQVCEAGIACFEAHPSEQIVVDCAGVTRADSAGLAVLIEWRRWAVQRHRHVTFTNLPTQINAIAHLSEVSQVLTDAPV